MGWLSEKIFQGNPTLKAESSHDCLKDCGWSSRKEQNRDSFRSHTLPILSAWQKKPNTCLTSSSCIVHTGGNDGQVHDCSDVRSNITTNPLFSLANWVCVRSGSYWARTTSLMVFSMHCSTPYVSLFLSPSPQTHLWWLPLFHLFSHTSFLMTWKPLSPWKETLNEPLTFGLKVQNLIFLSHKAELQARPSKA